MRVPFPPGPGSTFGFIWHHYFIIYENTYDLFSQSNERPAEQLGTVAAAIMAAVTQKEICTCSKICGQGVSDIHVWDIKLSERFELCYICGNDVRHGWKYMLLMRCFTHLGLLLQIYAFQVHAARGMENPNLHISAPLKCATAVPKGMMHLQVKLQPVFISPVVSSPSDPTLLSSATEGKQTH